MDTRRPAPKNPILKFNRLWLGDTRVSVVNYSPDERYASVVPDKRKNAVYCRVADLKTYPPP